MKKTMIFKKIAKKLLSKSPSLNTAVQTKKFELAHKQDFSNLEDYEKDLLIQVRDNSIKKVSGAEMTILPAIKNAYLFKLLLILRR